MDATTKRNMDAMLAQLLAQEEAAAKYPGAYSAGLWIGTAGCHVGTAKALLVRGLVVESERLGFRQIALNDAGRAKAQALRAVAA